ncbi:MAG TPA: hypothetical protein VF217_03580 [Rhodanobacteraceae bacterium]
MDFNTYFQNLSANPMFNMGMGMMAASGPSPYPVSGGQALAQGMQYAQQAQERALQLKAMQQKMAQQQAQQKAMQDWLGGGPSMA